MTIETNNDKRKRLRIAFETTALLKFEAMDLVLEAKMKNNGMVRFFQHFRTLRKNPSNINAKRSSQNDETLFPTAMQELMSSCGAWVAFLQGQSITAI